MMFIEEFSLIGSNAISLLAWIVNIIAFCSTTKKNNLVLRGVMNLLDIIIYGFSGLWYPCMTEGAKCFIFLYNAFFKFYNLIFTLIISSILIIWNVIKIGGLNNVNADNVIPIISFLLSMIGVTFFKSMHSIRIAKGIACLLYFCYDIKHIIIFSAAYDLFFVLLTISDILINRFDKEPETVKNW